MVHTLHHVTFLEGSLYYIIAHKQDTYKKQKTENTMGRDKQDSSRNFRSKSWNKIISVLRDRSCNFCSF